MMRGHGGVQYSGFAPNAFRSDQILKLSRMNTYQNKVNRSLSAARRNQLPTGPSLIVSIDNERAGPSSSPSIRGNIRGVRRGRGEEMGAAWNRQHANMFNAARRNQLPTGPSLIVSIDNERAGPSSSPSIRGNIRGVRRGRGEEMGAAWNRQHANMFNAARRNQLPTGPSLIVSIDNERAGPSSSPSIRGNIRGVRRGRGEEMGAAWNRQHANMFNAARRNQLPTGPSLIVSIDNERAGPSSSPSIRGNIRGVRRGRGEEMGAAWNRQHANMFNAARRNQLPTGPSLIVSIDNERAGPSSSPSIRGNIRGVRRGRGEEMGAAWNRQHANMFNAARRNQLPTGPSLIVSIDNERAGPSSSPSIRGNIRGVRRGRGEEMGAAWNRQHANMFNHAPVEEYQQVNTLPYHTGALDPEIQMVIADIQGKRKPNNFSSRGSMSRGGSLSRRGSLSMGGSDGVRGRGIGRVQHFGRTQVARRQDVNYARMNLGLPLGITINTLNKRFGGRR